MIEEQQIEETEAAEKTESTVEIVEAQDEAPEEAEEEVEEKIRPTRKEEEEFVEERVYTVPLRRAWVSTPKKRAPKAVRIIKAFVQRHMKVGEVPIEEGEEEERRIIISNEVNEKIWGRGIEKPPRKIRIRAAKDDKGNVTVFLA